MVRGGDGLDLTIFRPRTILGHGRLGIFAPLFNWIAEGKDVFVLGRGDNHYQFVRAEDLAEACVLAAARPGAGKMSAIPGTECTAPKCSRSQGATGRCTADWRPVD